MLFSNKELEEFSTASLITRSTNDIGITSNEFITSIVNLPRYQYNKSIFTEEEKLQALSEAIRVTKKGGVIKN